MKSSLRNFLCSGNIEADPGPTKCPFLFAQIQLQEIIEQFTAICEKDFQIANVGMLALKILRRCRVMDLFLPRCAQNVKQEVFKIIKG